MARPLATSVDGELLEPDNASISILDDGLLRGDGVFEVVKIYRGTPFRLGEHLDRLQSSAAAIELAVDRDSVEREATALVASVPGESLALRIVCTRGGRRIMIAEELPTWPACVRVATVELTPSELLGGVKSISYGQNMQSTRIALARGADEALWTHPSGTVLEAPTSSVFWAGADGRLRTPALELGILDSITRRVVVAALDVEQGSFDRSELAGASEAFLASTTREIQPIAAIDGAELPRCPGPATDRARRAFEEAVRAEIGAPLAPGASR